MLTILVGVVVLFGWATGIPALQSIFPNQVSMKASTALAFILSGVSLALLAPETVTPRMRRLSQLCAGAVLALALLALAEYVFGWNAGIDEAVVRDTSSVGLPFPGRMAPNTAYNFAAIGLALLLMEVARPRVHVLARWLALSALLVGLAALSGYAYSVGALYGIASYTPMALNTSLAFVILAIGIFCARPRSEVAELLTGDTVSGLLARRLLPAAVILPFVLGWVGLQGQRAGLYDTEFGTALFATVTTLLFVVLVWWNGQSLQRMEGKRRQAEAKALRLSEELEQRVTERTRELAARNDALSSEMQKRQQTETALQDSERRYRRVVDNANDIIYRTDDSGRFTFYNPTVTRVLGYDDSELLGRHYLDLVAPAFQRDASCIYRRQLTQRLANTYYEFPALAKDGTERWVGQNVQLLLEHDCVVGFQAVARDISERKQVEEILRQSEERFARAFEFAAIGMAMVSPEGRWLKVNQALCALVGYSADELLGLTFQAITHPDDLNADLELKRRLLAGEIQTHQMEKRYLHPSGSIVWASLSVSLVRDSEGQPLYFISQIEGIGERKRVESALLRQNAELAALSRMGRALSRLSEPDQLLEQIFQVIGTVLDNRNLYIALYDEAGGSISFPVYTIDAKRVVEPSRLLANGLTECIIRSKKPVFLPHDVVNVRMAWVSSRRAEPRSAIWVSRCWPAIR